MRRFALALLALTFLGPAAEGVATAFILPSCLSVVIDVPGQGPSCALPGGLWRVSLSDGASVETHGGDPAEPPSVAGYSVLMLAPIPPVCAPAGTYRGEVVYARPTGGIPTGFDPSALMEDANGFLHVEAASYGRVADYRMACDASGNLAVARVVLPTPNTLASFSTIVSDLRALGFDDPHTKYWVYYDAHPPGTLQWSGQGSIWGDDSLSPSNDNVVGGASYGITYQTTGAWGAHTMMHENGHNLGAVQLTAPHTSGGWHCNDGDDVMCYADGGSSSHYNPNVCFDRLHFDCGGDDYFNPAPQAGSYLATHWNLASAFDPFIDWQGPLGPAP